MKELEFSEAWKTLSDEQRRAIVLDVQCIEEEEGKKERQAVRVLIQRIGGLAALSGYADVLIASAARRRASL